MLPSEPVDHCAPTAPFRWFLQEERPNRGTPSLREPHLVLAPPGPGIGNLACTSSELDHKEEGVGLVRSLSILFGAIPAPTAFKLRAVGDPALRRLRSMQEP